MAAFEIPSNAKLRRIAPFVATFFGIWILMTAYLVSKDPPGIFTQPVKPPTPESCPNPPQQDVSKTLEDALQIIWKPILVDNTAPSFRDREGNLHELGQRDSFLYTKSLGKRIVILDVDTRPMDEEGQIRAAATPRWENLEHLSAGMLSHQLYAMIHGYDYKFVRSPEFEGHHGTWSKVPMTYDLLKSGKYDWVVTVDSDVEFTNPELPLEWMMNYWNLTATTALALAEDPAGGGNMDSKGNANFNTGFVFSQAAAPDVDELYKAWLTCTTEERYPGCGEWAYRTFHEQSALSEFVRYDFWDSIVKIPCAEANGSPQSSHMAPCTGQLVKHLWVDKKLAKPAFADGVMQALAPQIATKFQDNVLDYSRMYLSDTGKMVKEEQEEVGVLVGA